jgi:hypothetical protein
MASIMEEIFGSSTGKGGVNVQLVAETCCACGTPFAVEASLVEGG